MIVEHRAVCLKAKAAPICLKRHTYVTSHGLVEKDLVQQGPDSTVNVVNRVQKSGQNGTIECSVTEERRIANTVYRSTAQQSRAQHRTARHSSTAYMNRPEHGSAYRTLHYTLLHSNMHYLCRFLQRTEARWDSPHRMLSYLLSFPPTLLEARYTRLFYLPPPPDSWNLMPHPIPIWSRSRFRSRH